MNSNRSRSSDRSTVEPIELDLLGCDPPPIELDRSPTKLPTESKILELDLDLPEQAPRHIESDRSFREHPTDSKALELELELRNGHRHQSSRIAHPREPPIESRIPEEKPAHESLDLGKSVASIEPLPARVSSSRSHFEGQYPRHEPDAVVETNRLPPSILIIGRPILSIRTGPSYVPIRQTTGTVPPKLTWHGRRAPR